MVAAKPAVQAKPPVVKPEPKEQKQVAAPKAPVQGLPQVKDNNNYGEDELKALDGLEKAFAGHQESEEPLDLSKLEAEIKPAVQEIKATTVQEVKAASKAPPKASAAAQAAPKQAHAQKKPAQVKTAAKPVPQPQTRKLTALAAP